MPNMIRKQIAAGLVLLGGACVAASANAQVKGGAAVVAQQAAPPTLDAMVTAAQASRNITMNIFETLVTRDENGVPIADLAEKYDVSPDARSYTFHLRRGVKFHNGKEMTSADVVASLKRFGRIGARPYLRDVQSIEAPDAQTVVVKFADPLANFIDQLSSIGAPAVIIPEEEAGKELGKIDVIGTGPFQLVEFRPDSHVTLRRFENYVPNQNFESRSGLGGRKTPYLDSVTFRFMPEAGARAAALETGEVQVVESLATPTARRLANSKDIVAHELLPWAVQYIFMNVSDGPTKNVKIRRAIQAALDTEEIMAISTDGSYKLSWNWLYSENPYYAGEAGKALYNQKNAKLAKQLLQEGGYRGEEIVILTDSSFKNHQETAVVAAQQLTAIGMKVRLDVVDFPTAFAAKDKATGWNLYTILNGSSPFDGPHATMGDFVGPKSWQKFDDPRIAAAAKVLNTEPDIDKRKKAFAEFQQVVADEVYALPIGELGVYQATRKNLMNFKPYRVPRMWDVWLEKP